jgi:para-aminobenzoate synthetase component II
MILLIDNYDSFTFNLQRYLRRLHQSVAVARNDAPELNSLLEVCSAIVLSPGPKAPEQAGRSIEIVQRFSGIKPILGICLGHQTICAAFGGQIVRATRPLHGRATPIELSQTPLFANLPNPSHFARYHSLIADRMSFPQASLEVIAWSEEREIMAVAHRRHPTFGVQFHPESVLSNGGYQLLANFLTLSGLAYPDGLPTQDLETPPPSPPAAVNDLRAIGVEEHAVVLPKAAGWLP